MDPNLRFPQFIFLPIELRRMVYEQTMPPIVRQVLIYNPKKFPAWDARHGRWRKKDGPPTVPVKVPPILHVCKESRDFALEHVHICQEKKKGTRKRNADAYHHIVCRPFDVERDYIFVHHKYLVHFVKKVMKAIPWFIKRLIFMVEDFLRADLWDEDLVGRRSRGTLGTWCDFIDAAQQCTDFTSMNMVQDQAHFTDYDAIVDDTMPSHSYRFLDAGRNPGEDDGEMIEDFLGQTAWEQINAGKELGEWEIYTDCAIIERISG